MSEDATGSLIFLSRGERRRLRGAPPNWREMLPADLRNILASAELVEFGRQRA